MMIYVRVRVSPVLLPLAALVALSLVAAVLFVPPLAVAEAAEDGEPPADVSVPVSPVGSRASTAAAVAPLAVEPVVWPTAAAALVDLPVDASGVRTTGSVRVGGLPVKVAPVAATPTS